MGPTVPTTPAALTIRNLSKTFAGVRVLSRVDLDVAPGEVHALLGQNGSGKSTLIKCLAGVHRPDPGSDITVAGTSLPGAMIPSEAQRFGLAFVHQDLGLLPGMTVAENLAMHTGFIRRGLLLDVRAQRRATADVLDSFGLDLRANDLVRDLPVTARTLLAIARAFQPGRDSATPLRCLVLDEPTAALPDNDAELLFAATERVRSAGVGVVYVTHRLQEVQQIADRATVLRDGVRTTTLAVRGSSRQELVEAIIGRPEGDARPAAPAAPRHDGASAGPAALEVTGLSGARLADVTFSVRAGEIVGLAGLAGSGRSELARLVFGAQPHSAGTVRLSGEDLGAPTPERAMRAGLALVPEDRRRDGCVLTMTTAENLTLAQLPTFGPGFLSLRRERRQVADSMQDLDIRPADPGRKIGTLSGGNQQKAVLGKWLNRRPAVLILDEPVQGVDVGAKADIFAHLRRSAAEGAGVMVIDSDFENLALLCDRVLVLRAGAIVEELTGDRVTAAQMSAATFGVEDDALPTRDAPMESAP